MKTWQSLHLLLIHLIHLHLSLILLLLHLRLLIWCTRFHLLLISLAVAAWLHDLTLHLNLWLSILIHLRLLALGSSCHVLIHLLLLLLLIWLRILKKLLHEHLNCSVVGRLTFHLFLLLLLEEGLEDRQLIIMLFKKHLLLLRCQVCQLLLKALHELSLVLLSELLADLFLN